jgi:RNA polymerase sigma-70 factor (ECF subfamily)
MCDQSDRLELLQKQQRSLSSSLLESEPFLRRRATKMTGNPTAADDLVQETLMKAWANLDKFQVGTNLHGWLTTIMKNARCDDISRRRLEVEDPGEFLQATLTEKAPQEFVVDLKITAKYLHQLPEKYHSILGLKAQGYDNDEIAKLSGSSDATVKTRIHRARHHLENKLRAPRTIAA